MIYAMCTHITDADFLTEDARATVEVCDWAGLADELDEAVNAILGRAPTPESINWLLETQQKCIAGHLGQPDWDYIRKTALQRMEQKC